MVTHPILPEIEEFCRRQGIPEWKFGLQVMSDAKFVPQLRAGRSLMLRTELKVREHLAQAEA